MRTHLVPAALMLVLLTVLTGLAYPFAVTGVAQALFPHAANGSLLRRGDRIVGGDLVGQTYTDPRWFWGRPSATTPATNAAASSGSNLGPTNPALAEAVAAGIKALREADPENRDPIPVDLVTASASGIDPHISPAAARFQAARVAKARHLSRDRVLDLVERHVEGRALGILGEPRVNVLRLNLALGDLR